MDDPGVNGEQTPRPSAMHPEPETFDPYEGCEVLRAVVLRALSPFEGLPREDVEDLRDFLIVHITTHPAIEPLYARLRERKVPGRSGVNSGSTEEVALSQAAGQAARAARGGRS